MYNYSEIIILKCYNLKYYNHYIINVTIIVNYLYYKLNISIFGQILFRNFILTKSLRYGEAS